jgi:DNA repair protein RecO (recombination protein O)
VETLPAVVLKRAPHGETSLRVTLLAQGAGKISGLARGVRGGKRKGGHPYEPLNLGLLAYRPARRRGLHRLDSFRGQRGHFAIKEDLWRLAHALAGVERVHALLPEGVPEDGAFALFVGFLDRLELGSPPPPLALLALEMGLLRVLGELPQLKQCVRCRRPQARLFSPREGGLICGDCASQMTGQSPVSPGALAVLRKLQTTPWPDLQRLRLTQPLEEELRRLHRAWFSERHTCAFQSDAFLEQLAAERSGKLRASDRLG